MVQPDPMRAMDHRLGRLRQWRTRPDPDLSMGFLSKLFQEQVARPHKQLASITTVWQQFVPAGLIEHTRLESLKAGVLRVAVDSSAHLYELDRLLRGGLEQMLRGAHKGSPLKRVVLRVSESAGDESGGRKARG